MNVCIVFDSKHSKPEAIVSQTMGRDAQQAAKRRLQIYCRDTTTRAKGASVPPPPPPPFSQVTKKFNPKMQAFKRVFELLCRQGRD